MKTYNYAERNELEPYAKANGNYVPIDAILYQRLGLREHLCVFCDSEHGDYDTIEFKDGTQTNVCEDCSYDASLVDMGVSHFDIQPEAMEALDDYAFAQFPDWALDAHYNDYDSCIFCRQFTNNKEEYELPVGLDESNFLKFKVCDKCYPEYKKREENYLFHAIQEQCIKCSSNYPVTEEEKNARTKRMTENHHVCGECWIGAGHNSDDSRFKPVTCSGCRKDMIIPLTVPNTLNPDIVGADTYLCFICRKKGMNYEEIKFEEVPSHSAKTYQERLDELLNSDLIPSSENLLINFDGNITIIINSGFDGRFKYEIIEKMDNDEGYKTLAYNKRIYDKIQNCVIDGAYHAQKFVNRVSKQLEINL